MEPSDIRRRAKEQKMTRLRKVIADEGAELTNTQIRERMSVSNDLIAKVRSELGIPAPRSTMLTEDEMRRRGRYGRKK